MEQILPSPAEKDQPSRLLYAVNSMAEILLTSTEDNFGTALRKGMELIARCLDIDRVNIWQNEIRNNCLHYVLSCQWSDFTGMGETVHAQTGFTYSESIPEWEEKFQLGQYVNGPLCSLSQTEQQRLAPYGIQSILVIPIHVQGKFWGFLSFDDCHQERIFTKDEVSILRSGSLMIANAIEHHRTAVQIQAASKAKCTFLAQISHEIRTPLNVIAGMTELILREKIPTAIYENILSIKHATANMLSLIGDILDFSKIEAGSLEIIPAGYSLTSLINDILLIIRMKVSDTPLCFTANIDCNLPNQLIGDETRVRQILLNILDNSVKYTSEGFVSLTVTGEVEEDTLNLSVEVSDSGIGLKPENLDTLFEDFTRFDNLKNKNVQGSGLGLAIAKNLCQAMGGTISVHSKYGSGSTFVARIPQKIKSPEKFASVSNPAEKRTLLYEPRPLYAASLIRSFDNLGVSCTLVKSWDKLYEELQHLYPFVFLPSSSYESAARMIEEVCPETTAVLLTEFGGNPVARHLKTITMPAHASSIANILENNEENFFIHNDIRENIFFTAPSAEILLVDDLDTNLEVAKGLMQPYQMNITVCGSGREAVEHVRQKHYDIIFMDHMMQEMDGIEAACRIRSLEDGSGYYQNVPIIALTANAISGIKEMFLQAGMNDFLAKPIDMIKLHNLLEKWIPAAKKEPCRKEEAEQLFPAVSSLSLEIEGVNVQTGIALAGTSEAYFKTLMVFYTEGLAKINKLRDCVKTNDIGLYTVYVHALKGAAANIGAQALSDLFKSLEMAGTGEDIEFIRDNTEPVIEKLTTLLQNIHAVIVRDRHYPGTADNDTNNDWASISNELTRLKEALDNRDAGEIDDIMNALESVRLEQDWHSGGLFQEIIQNILLINYADAASLVDELMTSAVHESSQSGDLRTAP